MKHFRRLDIPAPDKTRTILQKEVALNEHLWSLDSSRQNRISVQRHTQSIPLRVADRKPGDKRTIEDIHGSRVAPFSAAFPMTMSFLLTVAQQLKGSLERALYVRLLPRSIVYPHIDEGAYYASTDRYHYVVISTGGSLLKAGNEEVTMRPGELWWFDNKALHESANLSDEWRVHLIFDIF